MESKKRTLAQAQFLTKGQPKGKLRRQNTFGVNPPLPKRGTKEEKKNLDNDLPTQITFGSAAGVVTLLNGIAQGAAETQRQGRDVHMRSIFWRFVGHIAPTTTGASSMRILIVYDKQTNKAAPVATDILTIDSIESGMNLANNHRFQVIADEEIPCVGTAGPQSWNIKGYRKINLPTEFTGNAGGVANITSGGVFSLVYQDGGLLVANPVSQLFTRIRYVDA